MQSDEKIKNSFEIIASPHGRGQFYITNMGVYFDSLTYGRVLNLGFDVIVRYDVQGHKFRIDWTDNNTKLYYVMTAPSSKQIFSAYQSANEEYAQSRRD